MLLNIRIQPQVRDAKIHVQQIPRPDHIILGPIGETPQVFEIGGIISLNGDRWMKPGGKAKPGHFLAEPPDQVIGGGDARRDDLGRKTLGNDIM